jgi:hypothetical protein
MPRSAGNRGALNLFLINPVDLVDISLGIFGSLVKMTTTASLNGLENSPGMERLLMPGTVLPI